MSSLNDPVPEDQAPSRALPEFGPQRVHLPQGVGSPIPGAAAHRYVRLLDEDFRDRTLPFDRAAARVYATVAAARRAAGLPISQFDCQIAAIARTHEATERSDAANQQTDSSV